MLIYRYVDSRRRDELMKANPRYSRADSKLLDVPYGARLFHEEAIRSA